MCLEQLLRRMGMSILIVNLLAVSTLKKKGKKEKGGIRGKLIYQQRETSAMSIDTYTYPSPLPHRVYSHSNSPLRPSSVTPDTANDASSLHLSVEMLCRSCTPDYAYRFHPVGRCPGPASRDYRLLYHVLALLEWHCRRDRRVRRI